MSTQSGTYIRTEKSSTIQAYHSNVLRQMCSQMVSQHDRPLPLARRPISSSSSSSSPGFSSSSTTPSSSASFSRSCSPPKSSRMRSGSLSQHVEEEMARRVKADRVLQDLSSDKSRELARARETARRNKWAQSVASVCPANEMHLVRDQIAMAKDGRPVPIASCTA